MVYFTFVIIILGRFFGMLKNLFLRRPQKTLLSGARGMNIYYDVIDWLGGYPYEYATFDEIKNFVEKLGFKLIKDAVKLPSQRKTLFNRLTFRFTGNNEFVFKKY
jgi:hypothetical protein